VSQGPVRSVRHAVLTCGLIAGLQALILVAGCSQGPDGHDIPATDPAMQTNRLAGTAWEPALACRREPDLIRLKDIIQQGGPP